MKVNKEFRENILSQISNLEQPNNSISIGENVYFVGLPPKDEINNLHINADDLYSVLANEIIKMVEKEIVQC